MAVTDLKTLRQCLRVAELGSLSRAAEALNIAQPWLSTRIRNYEAGLGFAIFDRSRRRLALTPEGEAFVALARRFSETAERFVEDSAVLAVQARKVELQVGCPSAGSGVEERNALIAAFRAGNPDVAIRIRLLSGDQIVEGLGNGKLDLGMLLDPLPQGLADGAIALRRQHAVLFMPQVWKRAPGSTIDLAELRGRAIAVMPENYHPELCTPIYAELRASGAQLHEMADDNFLALHAHAVKHGIAALTVDTFAESLAPFAGYICYPLDGEIYHSTLHLVRPRAEAPGAAQAFWDFSRSRLSPGA